VNHKNSAGSELKVSELNRLSMQI